MDDLDPIPEIPLVMQPKTAEAKAAIGFQWAPSTIPEHKIGGSPNWIQADETPICCESRMTFYGQLDSLGDNVSLGDGGMIYVFYCRTCLSASAILQCC